MKRELVTETLKALCRTSPAVKRAILIAFYNFLARRFDRTDWTYMNYGYADGEGETPPDLPDALNGEYHCARLYQRVAGAVPLVGADILEIGCGRGGGCALLRETLGAASVTGLDFAAGNIDFCRTRFPLDGLRFVEGDASRLPFTDNSFDAVVNIESSHCYPSIPAFLLDVRRVLRPGGHFLYADLRTPEAMNRLEHELHGCGMRIVEQEDITRQVIRALDADNARKSAMIDGSVPRPLRPSFREFSAVKDSANYERFATGKLVYRRFALRKTEGPPADTPKGDFS